MNEWMMSKYAWSPGRMSRSVKLWGCGLQREEHSRLAHVEAERHLRHAFLHEDVLDFLRRRLEEPDLGADRSAHSGIAGVHVVVVEPGTVELVVARRRTEIPHPRVAVAGEQAIADELVARPFADHGARHVADVVLVEAQHRTEPGGRERLASARDPVAGQAAEVGALLEVDLRDAGRLQRAVPAVPGIQVAFVDRNEAGVVLLLPHAAAPH